MGRRTCSTSPHDTTDAAGGRSGIQHAPDRKHKVGSSGSAYLDETLVYTVATYTVGGVDINRPVVTSRRLYPEAITSGTTGSVEWTFSSTFGSTANEALALVSRTTTEPAVTTANNGSNSSNTTKVHYTLRGDSDFAVDQLGRVTYREYSNRQVTKVVQDADTTSLSPPTGFASDGSGDEVAWTTTYTYDAQGRQDEVDIPGDEVKKSYTSRLLDRRVVTLQYNDYESGTPTFYGPVRLQVRNPAGQTVASGVVALTSNQSTSALTAHVDETDDDIITAIDVGTVAKLSTIVYDEAGTQLDETRLYFSMPSTEPGTEGTHFDATYLGYDDLGRRVRRKEPHGTIYRTVYDLRSQVTGKYIGTNEYSFAGGESTGPDNMTQTVAREYDSGTDDGNGMLTEETRYVVDGTAARIDVHETRRSAAVADRPGRGHEGVGHGEDLVSRPDGA